MNPNIDPHQSKIDADKKEIINKTIRILDELPHLQSLAKSFNTDKLHEKINPKILKSIQELLKIKADLTKELAHDSPQNLKNLLGDIMHFKNDLISTNITNENFGHDIDKINMAYRDIANQQHQMHLAASVTPERIAELSAEAAKEMEHEYAGRMVKSNLFNICEQARALMPMFEDDENVEPWLEEKIAVAAHMISTAHQYKNYDTNSDKALPPEMSRKITAKYLIKK
jgi:hypothetical protein